MKRIGLRESFALTAEEQAQRRAERAAVDAAVEARRRELAAEAELWRVVIKKLKGRL